MGMNGGQDSGVEASFVEGVWLKVEQSGVLTEREFAAVRRSEKSKLGDQFADTARRLPQKTVCDLFQTTRKVLGEWQLEGLPRNDDKGRTYDLFNVFLWVKGRWFKTPDDSDMIGNSEHVEKFRKYKARMMELQVKEKEGELVPRAEIREGLSRMAGLLRALGARLQRSYGARAQEMINETLDEFEKVIETEFTARASKPKAEKTRTTRPQRASRQGVTFGRGQRKSRRGRDLQPKAKAKPKKRRVKK